MRRNLLLLTIGGLLATIVHAGPEPPRVQAQTDAALTGRVISTRKRKARWKAWWSPPGGRASTISMSVVTDDRGRYNFPESKLGSGDYLLKIRAIGYELLGPTAIDVRGRSHGERGHQVEADERSRRAAHQRRVAGQHARLGSAEEVPALLQQLPFLSADRQFHARRGRVPAGLRQDGRLLSRQHAAAPAAARRYGTPQSWRRRRQRDGWRGNERGSARQSRRGLARHREPQQRPDSRLPVQDAAAAQRARARA